MKYHNGHLDRSLSQYMRYCWMVVPEGMQLFVNDVEVRVQGFKVSYWVI